MNYGLYLSASGVLTSMHRQDVIANNLANVATVGFKPDDVTLMARQPERIENGPFSGEDSTRSPGRSITNLWPACWSRGTTFSGLHAHPVGPVAAKSQKLPRWASRLADPPGPSGSVTDGRSGARRPTGW